MEPESITYNKVTKKFSDCSHCRQVVWSSILNHPDDPSKEINPKELGIDVVT